MLYSTLVCTLALRNMCTNVQSHCPGPMSHFSCFVDGNVEVLLASSIGGGVSSGLTRRAAIFSQDFYWVTSEGEDRAAE